MDALELAKERMEWMEQWSDAAEDATTSADIRDAEKMEEICRADAEIYAAIALAEQVERVADAMEGFMRAYTMVNFGSVAAKTPGSSVKKFAEGSVDHEQ